MFEAIKERIIGTFTVKWRFNLFLLNFFTFLMGLALLIFIFKIVRYYFYVN
jgi:hypothetical protein